MLTLHEDAFGDLGGAHDAGLFDLPGGGFGLHGFGPFLDHVGVAVHHAVTQRRCENKAK